MVLAFLKYDNITSTFKYPDLLLYFRNQHKHVYPFQFFKFYLPFLSLLIIFQIKFNQLKFRYSIYACSFILYPKSCMLYRILASIRYKVKKNISLSENTRWFFFLFLKKKELSGSKSFHFTVNIFLENIHIWDINKKWITVILG